MILAPPVGRHVTKVMARRIHCVVADPDRGDVIGWVITVPVIMLLTIGSVQAVLWYQARNVCQGAVQAGVRSGKTLDAPVGTGQAAAMSYLSETGGDTVVGGRAAERLTATTITVSCVASAERVIPLPGLSIAVEASASSQRERFTTRNFP